MNRIPFLIYKFLAGIRRYGFVRAATGTFTFLKFKVLRPASGRISIPSNRLVINFDYPGQFMPMLAIFKEPAEPEIEFLRHVLDRDSVFFDVGGGIGVYSLFAARLVDSPVRIFEPLEENIRTIEKNLRDNSLESKVRLNKAALSDKAGFGQIVKKGKLFLSRLEDVSEQRSAGSVTVTTLDRFCSDQKIDHIDVLKIDVENHEPEVLQGARELLAGRKIHVIILESSTQLQRSYGFLQMMGFEFFYYEYTSRSLRHVRPVNEENLKRLKPSPFHSNLLLIHNDVIEKIRQRLKGSNP